MALTQKKKNLTSSSYTRIPQILAGRASSKIRWENQYRPVKTAIVIWQLFCDWMDMAKDSADQAPEDPQ